MVGMHLFPYVNKICNNKMFSSYVPKQIISEILHSSIH